MRFICTTFLVICMTMATAMPSYAWDDCTMKGKKMHGKVKIVEHSPDIKVKVVESSPDLKVKVVNYSADSCGKWQFVDYSQDFTIKFVESSPDLKVKFVESSPGR